MKNKSFLDTLILNPVLKVITWAKRHPLAVLLILFLLWIAPTFLSVLGRVVSIFLDIFAKIFGLEFAIKAAALASKFTTWLGEKQGRCYWVGTVVSFISPLIGFTLLAWCFLDRFKTAPTLKVVPSPAPTPEPDLPEIVPDVGAIFDDYWGQA